MFLARSFGATGYEERIVRSDGAWSVLHRPSAPSARGPLWRPSELGPPPAVECVHPDGAIARRVMAASAVPGGDDALGARLPVLYNASVCVSLVRAKTSRSSAYADHDGDAFVCVIEGVATLETPFGQLRVGAAESVWMPRHVPHRWRVETPGFCALVLETRGELRVPEGYMNRRGQLGARAPYGERDLRAPAWTPRTERPSGKRETFAVSCRREGRRYDAEIDDDALAVVGWDGVVYPVAFGWEVASSRGYARERATLFEHDALMVTTCVTREDLAPPPVGDDLVTLAVDGEGEAVVVFEPGCVAPRPVGVVGGVTITLHTREPLKLTPNGAMLAG